MTGTRLRMPRDVSGISLNQPQPFFLGRKKKNSSLFPFSRCLMSFARRVMCLSCIVQSFAACDVLFGNVLWILPLSLLFHKHLDSKSPLFPFFKDHIPAFALLEYSTLAPKDSLFCDSMT